MTMFVRMSELLAHLEYPPPCGSTMAVDRYAIESWAGASSARVFFKLRAMARGGPVVPGVVVVVGQFWDLHQPRCLP
jgi:hypothetical protein